MLDPFQNFGLFATHILLTFLKEATSFSNKKLFLLKEQTISGKETIEGDPVPKLKEHWLKARKKEVYFVYFDVGSVLEFWFKNLRNTYSIDLS